MTARLLALLLLMLAADARAACMGLCTCTVSTTAVAFGTHNPLLAANTDSTGTVRVACSGTSFLTGTYQISLGTGSSASYATRRMTSGANTLNYNLYTDSNRTIVWGDGSASTQTVSGAFSLDLLGNTPAQTTTVYGRVPGSQTGVKPGAYADSVSVTVTYF